MNWSKIEEARRFLGIYDYPGNLFNLFSNTEKMIRENKIVLFKEDIDEVSGFIGYSSGYTIICINHKNNIGHQNFTLAHELGHMFLHNGIPQADKDLSGAGGQKEREANEFARELIYPKELAMKDKEHAISNDLLNPRNIDKLAEYISELSCKYCTSFKFTYYRIFDTYFKNFETKKNEYSRLKRYIGKLPNRFPDKKHMYVVVKEHKFYKADYRPYEYMINLINDLSKSKDIGYETGQAIIDKYESLGGNE